MNTKTHTHVSLYLFFFVLSSSTKLLYNPFCWGRGCATEATLYSTEAEGCVYGTGFCVGRDCDVGQLWLAEVCAEARHLTFLGLDDRSSLGGPSALAGVSLRQDDFYSACSVCYKKKKKEISSCKRVSFKNHATATIIGSPCIVCCWHSRTTTLCPGRSQNPYSQENNQGCLTTYYLM